MCTATFLDLNTEVSSAFPIMPQILHPDRKSQLENYLKILLFCQTSGAVKATEQHPSDRKPSSTQFHHGSSN
jgi:hypothetical protein